MKIEKPNVYSFVYQGIDALTAVNIEIWPMQKLYPKTQNKGKLKKSITIK